MTDEEFTRMYLATSAALHAYLSRVGGDASLADDLAQEAYLRLLRAPAPPTESERCRAYLFRIATNLLHDERRRRAGDERREAKLVHLETGNAGSGVWGVETQVAPPPDPTSDAPLRQAFRLLNERDRELLWLAYVTEMSHREIAEVVGVGSASVRVLLLRARRRLATLLSSSDPARAHPGGRG